MDGLADEGSPVGVDGMAEAEFAGDKLPSTEVTGSMLFALRANSMKPTVKF